MSKKGLMAILIIILIVIVSFYINKQTTTDKVTVDPQSEVKNKNDQADTSYDKTKAVFAVGEWKPYVSESLPFNGFSAEIVKNAYSNVGIDVKLEFYPGQGLLY